MYRLYFSINLALGNLSIFSCCIFGYSSSEHLGCEVISNLSFNLLSQVILIVYVLPLINSLQIGHINVLHHFLGSNPLTSFSNDSSVQLSNIDFDLL